MGNTVALLPRCYPSGDPLTLSGNEVLDWVRAAGAAGDGLPVGSGIGIWPATTPAYVWGFESGTTGWSARNNATIAQSTVQGKFGTHSLLVTTTNLNTNDAGQYTFTPSSGTQYTVSIWVYRTETAQTLQLFWRSSTNADVVAPVNVPQVLGWSRVTMTATPSESLAETIGVWVLAGATPPSITFYLDGFQIEPGSIATPFIGDGNTTRAAGRVQVPATLLSAAQGWLSFTWIYRSAAGVSEQLFNWSAGVNNTIQVFLNSVATAFVLNQAHGGTLVSNSSNLSPTAGQRINVTIAWTASQTTLYVNGAGKSTAVITGTPAGLPSLFDLGSSGSGTPINGELGWFTTGTGTLAAADAATLNGFGSTPPTWTQLQALNSGAANPTAVWPNSALPGTAEVVFTRPSPLVNTAPLDLLHVALTVPSRPPVQVGTGPLHLLGLINTVLPEGPVLVKAAPLALLHLATTTQHVIGMGAAVGTTHLVNLALSLKAAGYRVVKDGPARGRLTARSLVHGRLRAKTK